MKRILTLLLLLASAGPALANDAVQDVLACMRANVPLSISMASVTLTTTDRSGEKSTLAGKFYATRGKDKDGHTTLRAMLSIDKPEAQAGSAYLVRGTGNNLPNSMFVYLPTLGRVRRVTGNFAEGALLGTNFSYSEFRLLKDNFSEMKPALAAPDSYNGRGAYVLIFTPLPGADTVYTKIKVWVDKEACIAVKANFMQQDNLIKQLTSPKGSLHKDGKYWYLSSIKISVPAKASNTVLTTGEVVNEVQLSDVYFNPSTFYEMR